MSPAPATDTTPAITSRSCVTKAPSEGRTMPKSPAGKPQAPAAERLPALPPARQKERSMQAGRTIPSTFATEQVQAIERAYDLTCASLGLSRTADQITEIVAETIIDLARTEADPERLSREALAQLRATVKDQ